MSSEIMNLSVALNIDKLFSNHGQFIYLLYELIEYSTIKTKSWFTIQMFSEKWKGFQIKRKQVWKRSNVSLIKLFCTVKICIVNTFFTWCVAGIEKHVKQIKIIKKKHWIKQSCILFATKCCLLLQVRTYSTYFVRQDIQMYQKTVSTRSISRVVNKRHRVAKPKHVYPCTI